MLEPPLAMIRSLAETARLHAQDVHGLTLRESGIEIVDRILAAERNQLQAAQDWSGQEEWSGQAHSLSLCYGAWLGELLCSRHQGEWIGLNEPVPPRVRCQGLVLSPIDACRRRLTSTSAPTLGERVEQLLRAPHPSHEVRSGNRIAWDSLADDPRFVTNQSPPDRETAHASLDLWLQQWGVEGRRVLCLAAGGGTHGPLIAAAGAEVTVVDLSERQLEHDRRLSQAAGLNLRTACTSIDSMPMLEDQSFDVVVQPVSSCYLEDLTSMFAEVARVLVPGGLYVSQHKQPTALRAGGWIASHGGFLIDQMERCGWPVKSPQDRTEVTIHDPGTIEFAHSLQAILGGICHAGFQIEDVIEPVRGDAFSPSDGSMDDVLALRACYLPPYLKIKAIRH